MKKIFSLILAVTMAAVLALSVCAEDTFVFKHGFDLDYKPYIFGISPCIGLGFVDMDLVLPVELRFGRVFSKWYVMGELLYGISLANETICIEPSIRIGYNFGPRKRSRKK